MRKQLLGVFLPLLLLSLMAATAETQGNGSITKQATLQRLDITRGDDGVNVEITAHGQVTPNVTTLESPARVVIDLPQTVAVTAQRNITVGSDGVKGVRVGMDGQTPPTTRVVVDLVRACKYELVPGADGKMTLKLYTGSATASAKEAPKAAPKAPAAKLVAVSAPVSAPAPAIAKPMVKPAVTAAAAPETKTAKAASANDYVFVEPSYKPKDDAKAEENKTAAIEPPARVMEAASKFADKPASELIQKNDHAAMQAQSSSGNFQPAVNLAAEQKTQMSTQPSVSGPKYTGEPISVNLKDVDLKDFFRLIHEISGLNVVLDPNVHGTLTIVMDDVPWDQALDIVLKNNELAR